jgi:hypothetical protein
MQALPPLSGIESMFREITEGSPRGGRSRVNHWLLFCVAAVPLVSSDAFAQAVVGGEGQKAETIGRIVDVAVDRLGRAYILDGAPPQILVVENGFVIQRVGRAGSGPGEFRSPTKIQLDGDGRIYVLDAGQRRMSVFRTEPRLTHEADFRIPFVQPRTFCMIGSQFFMLTADAGAPGIRIAERAGDSLRQRGVLAKFESDHVLAVNPMFAATVGFRGYLACVPEEHRIIWANMILGDIRSVSTVDSGSRLAHLDGFAAATIGLRRDVLDLSFSPAQRMDLLLAFVPVSSRETIATVGVKTPSEPIDLQTFAKLESQSVDGLLRASTRQPAHAILGAASSTTIVCYVNDPVPTVWVKPRASRPTCG